MRNRGLLFAHPRDCPVRVNLVILSTLWARLLDPSQRTCGPTPGAAGSGQTRTAAASVSQGTAGSSAICGAKWTV